MRRGCSYFIARNVLGATYEYLNLSEWMSPPQSQGPNWKCLVLTGTFMFLVPVDLVTID